MCNWHSWKTPSTRRWRLSVVKQCKDDITRSAATWHLSDKISERCIGNFKWRLYGKSFSQPPIFNRIQHRCYEPCILFWFCDDRHAICGASPRPLMKIRFDRPDVDYTQALYMSLTMRLKNIQIHHSNCCGKPCTGNPAKLAIEGTRSSECGKGIAQYGANGC